MQLNMNTNSNIYTVVYTAVVVAVVAAVLAFVAMKLKPMQDANVKAETLSQIMISAKIATKAEFAEMSNDAILDMYSENVERAFVVSPDGDKTGELSTDRNNIELIDNFKPQDVAIKAGEKASLPVYVFKNGVSVVPVYGAGLWGPIWGYIALQPDLKTIAGAYFDHASETPGLGSKIKDEPWFQEQFVGKVIDFSNSDALFEIVKGGAPEGAESKVDAITGATMTSKGLDKAINVWFGAYSKYLSSASAATTEEE